MSTVELSTEGEENVKDPSLDCLKIENDPSQSSLKMNKDREDASQESSDDDRDISCKIEGDKAADKKEEDSISKDHAELDGSTETGSNEKVDDVTAKDDGRAKNNDVKASLNAIFARNESRKQVVEEKSKEEKVAEEEVKKDETEDDVVVKKIDSEDLAEKKKEDDKTSDGTDTAAVPDIIVEETEDDLSQLGMKSSEEKKPRFTFFKKNKKSAELSVDSETKSDNGSVKSGGFNRRNKTFNPFKSVRKAVNKYRNTRRPPPEVVVPPPVIIEPEPEPIDPEKLEELRQEVCVVQDIRKNRPRGPQGRKRKSMRPCSTADGSETGTPVVAQLEDLLNGEDQGGSRSNSLVNGNSLSVDLARAPCKSDGKSASSPNKNGDVHDPPESDLMKSDVGNLASSSQVTGNTDQENAESSTEGKDACAEKDISVEGAFCTSALGNLSVINTGEES